MNKSIKYYIVCFIIMGLFVFSGCQNNNYSVIEEYCYKINFLIKDVDFHTAKIKEREIVLYDNKNSEIERIPFEEYENNKRITAIRKDGARVYFTISETVDDEQGIVFINDDSNSVLDGIKSIERIAGNSYWYSTNE